MDNSKITKKEVIYNLKVIKKQVTDTGQMYLSLLPKPLPINDFLNHAKPFIKMEKSLAKLIKSLQ